MRNPTLPETTAQTRYIEVCDQDGHPLLVPAVWIEHLISAGIDQIVATIRVPGTGGWITRADAIERYLADDMLNDGKPDVALRRAAGAKIDRACASGDITCQAHSGAKMINRASFDAWRLRLRDDALSRDE